MKSRFKTLVLAATLALTFLGQWATAEPADESVLSASRVLGGEIRQYGGSVAGPDLRPYSRNREKGDIVGRPPAKNLNKAPVNSSNAVSPSSSSNTSNTSTVIDPVSSVTPPPQLPPKNVAGGLPIQQLFDNGSLIPTWKGQGKVAGEMLELTLQNMTDQPIAIDLDPGMVLTLGEDRLAKEFQPVLIETDSVLLVPARGTLVKMLRGYCLDYSLEPPAAGRAFPYAFPADAMAYTPAVDVLKASLTYDAEQNVMPPDKQRTIVIQRAIWAALGQNDKEKLYEDILADAAQAGKTISKKKARSLADALWSEVQRLMQMAQ